MASACLIVNEWLLHDLRGDNGQEKQAESYRFLEKLKEKCDHKDNIKEIPANVKELVPQDDVYLIECYYSAQASLLVTTDQKLHDALSNVHGINIQMRDAFIQHYLLVS